MIVPAPQDPEAAQARVFRELLAQEIETTIAQIEQAEQNRDRAAALRQSRAHRYHQTVVRDLRAHLYELHRQDRALAQRFT